MRVKIQLNVLQNLLASAFLLLVLLFIFFNKSWPVFSRKKKVEQRAGSREQGTGNIDQGADDVDLLAHVSPSNIAEISEFSPRILKCPGSRVLHRHSLLFSPQYRLALPMASKLQ
jgi:hypothetical protein